MKTCNFDRFDILPRNEERFMKLNWTFITSKIALNGEINIGMQVQTHVLTSCVWFDDNLGYNNNNKWHSSEDEALRLKANIHHDESEDEEPLPPEPRPISTLAISNFQSDDIESLLNEDLLKEIEKQYLKSNNKLKNKSPITSTRNLRMDHTIADSSNNVKSGSIRDTSEAFHHSSLSSHPIQMDMIHIIKGVVSATGSNCYKIITEQYIKDVVKITKTSLMWISNISKTDHSSCILELKSISSLKKNISPCEKVVRISVYSSQKGRPRKCVVSTSHHPNFGFKVLTEDWIFDHHLELSKKGESSMLLPDTISFPEHLVLRYLSLTFIGSQTFSSTHRIKHLSVTLEDNIQDEEYLDLVRQELVQGGVSSEPIRLEKDSTSVKNAKKQLSNPQQECSHTDPTERITPPSQEEDEPLIVSNKDIDLNNNETTTSNAMLMKILNTSTQSDQFTDDSLLEDLDDLRDELKGSTLSMDSSDGANNMIETLNHGSSVSCPIFDEFVKDQRVPPIITMDEELIQKEIEEIEAKLIEKKQKLDSLNNSPVKNLISQRSLLIQPKTSSGGGDGMNRVDVNIKGHSNSSSSRNSSSTIGGDHDSHNLLLATTHDDDESKTHHERHDMNHPTTTITHQKSIHNSTSNIHSNDSRVNGKKNRTRSNDDHTLSENTIAHETLNTTSTTLQNKSKNIHKSKEKTLSLNKHVDTNPIVSNKDSTNSTHPIVLNILPKDRTMNHTRNFNSNNKTKTHRIMNNDDGGGGGEQNMTPPQQQVQHNLSIIPNNDDGMNQSNHSKPSVSQNKTRNTHMVGSTPTTIDISCSHKMNHMNISQNHPPDMVRNTSNHHLLVIEFSPNSQHDLQSYDRYGSKLEQPTSMRKPNSSLIHFLYDIKKKQQEKKNIFNTNSHETSVFHSKEQGKNEKNQEMKDHDKKLPIVNTDLQQIPSLELTDFMKHCTPSNQPSSSHFSTFEDHVMHSKSESTLLHHNSHVHDESSSSNSSNSEETQSDVSSDITLTVVAEDDDDDTMNDFGSSHMTTIMMAHEKNYKNIPMLFNVPPFTMSYNTSPRVIMNEEDPLVVKLSDSRTFNEYSIMHDQWCYNREEEEHHYPHHTLENDDLHDDDDLLNDDEQNHSLLDDLKNTRIGHTPIRAPPSPPFRVINDDTPPPSNTLLLPSNTSSLISSLNFDDLDFSSMETLNDHQHVGLHTLDGVNQDQNDDSSSVFQNDEQEEMNPVHDALSLLNTITDPTTATSTSTLDILKQLEEEMTKSLYHDVVGVEHSSEIVKEPILEEYEEIQHELSQHEEEIQHELSHEENHDDIMSSNNNNNMTTHKDDRMNSPFHHSTEIIGETIQLDDERTKNHDTTQSNNDHQHFNQQLTLMTHSENPMIVHEEEHDIIQSFLDETNTTSCTSEEYDLNDSPNITPRNTKTNNTTPYYYLRNSQSSPVFHTPSLLNVTTTPSTMTPSRLLLKGEPTRLFSLKKGIECFQHVYDMKKKNFKKSKRLIKLDRDSKILTISRKAQLFKKSVKINIYKDLKWIVYGPYSKTFKDELYQYQQQQQQLQQQFTKFNPHTTTTTNHTLKRNSLQQDHNISLLQFVPWRCFSMVTVHGVYCFEISNHDKELDDFILGLQFLTKSVLEPQRPIYTKHSLVVKRLFLKREYGGQVEPTFLRLAITTE
ncbi:hypothetical protein C9374_010432 [Naegleria lovaniensis]|uniref:Uncharacterized protein n=1 Tax=Naegleria lovaniensis TaxID=51637 RepID=A0AA88KE46_NAELO|nr:uncharacterized protein C9374_010432 [Naegleria lovaniensis]KAG2374688.1 hypothetical protein C9374_010432 [Naegleria lovaniensis]